MSHRDVWSLRLGRWGGVNIRLHIFFVLFGVFTGFLAWKESSDGAGNSSMMWLALLSMFLLLVSVLLHELGHYVVARRLGGHMDALVLGPLGGLRPARVPQDPQSELLAVMAGPATTLAIGVFCILIYSVAFGDFDLWSPLGSRASEIGGWQILHLAGWINGWLLLINLIPAFPFDGGRAFSSLIQVIKPNIDNHRATTLVATFARLVAVLLFLSAFVFSDGWPDGAVPSWMPLILLAVFVFFSARVEEAQLESEDEESDLFGYDFSQGYTSLERSAVRPPRKPGPITRWMDRRREKRRIRREAIAAAEHRQVDEILRLLHENGFESLSPDERALLKRVSARLRTREDS